MEANRGRQLLPQRPAQLRHRDRFSTALRTSPSSATPSASPVRSMAFRSISVITNNFLARVRPRSPLVASSISLPRAAPTAFHGETSGSSTDLAAHDCQHLHQLAEEGEARAVTLAISSAGAIGGPIYRDKLFFFGSTEFTRVRSSAQNISVISNLAEFLNGDISQRAVLLLHLRWHREERLLSARQPRTSERTGGGICSTLQASGSLPCSSTCEVSFAAPGDAGGWTSARTPTTSSAASTTTSVRRPKPSSDSSTITSSISPSAAFSSPYSQYNVGESISVQAYLLSTAHEFQRLRCPRSPNSASPAPTSRTPTTPRCRTFPLCSSRQARRIPPLGRAFQLLAFMTPTRPTAATCPSADPRTPFRSTRT